MESLDRLRAATIQAQQQNELPDELAARIFTLAGRLEGTGLLQDQVVELIEQVSLYDTYGQTGYIGMGVNNVILEATISRIEQTLQQHLLKG